MSGLHRKDEIKKKNRKDKIEKIKNRKIKIVRSDF